MTYGEFIERKEITSIQSGFDVDISGMGKR